MRSIALALILTVMTACTGADDDGDRSETAASPVPPLTASPVRSYQRHKVTRTVLRNLPILATPYIKGSVHAFDVLSDPTRRRILELLATGERTAGAVTEVVTDEFGISQPTVSGHLRVLRESGFTTVRHEGTRRLYAVDSAPLQEIDRWLDGFRRFWAGPLDALATELARGKRQNAKHGNRQTHDHEGKRDKQ